MATFTTTVTAVRTVTMDGLPDVVIIVDWNRTGVEAGQTFQLSGTSTVGPINPSDFTPFDQLTEEQVAGWVNAKEDTPEGQFPSMDAHIQYVLNKMIVDSQGTPTPLPWAPPAPTPDPLPQDAPQP